MWGVGIYNQLVALKNRFQNAFSQIEVQLKRRYDLIPNLVETVKGYMAHEKGTLEAVIQARNQAVSGLSSAAANPGDPAAMQALASAEQGLSGALGRLFALAEAYPDLKANQNMAQLTEEITSTENQRGLRPPGVQRRGDAVQHLPPELPAGDLSPACSATARTRSSWTSTTPRSPKRRRCRSLERIDLPQRHGEHGGKNRNAQIIAICDARLSASIIMHLTSSSLLRALCVSVVTNLMATDFFERQSVARRNTKWLVVMFVLAVIGIVGTTFVVTAIARRAQRASGDRSPIGASGRREFGCALALIGGGSAVQDRPTGRRRHRRRRAARRPARLSEYDRPDRTPAA